MILEDTYLYKDKFARKSQSFKLFMFCYRYFSFNLESLRAF